MPRSCSSSSSSCSCRSSTSSSSSTITTRPSCQPRQSRSPPQSPPPIPTVGAPRQADGVGEPQSSRIFCLNLAGIVPRQGLWADPSSQATSAQPWGRGRRPGGCSLLSFSLRPASEALASGGPPVMRSLSTTSTGSSSGAPGPSGLARQNSTSLTGKPGSLPANLDDMKVGGHLKVRESSQLSTHGHGRPSRAPDSGLWQRHLEPVPRPAWPWSRALGLTQPLCTSSLPGPLQGSVGDRECPPT